MVYFGNSFIEIQFPYHIICLVKIYNSMVLMYSYLCNYKYNQFENIFITPKEALYTLAITLLFFRSLPPTLN